MARRRPCVRFNKLKMLVENGPDMSHKDIMKVWTRILVAVNITTEDKAALDALSEALLDYYEESADLIPCLSPEQLVQKVLLDAIPANWCVA